MNVKFEANVEKYHLNFMDIRQLLTAIVCAPTIFELAPESLDESQCGVNHDLNHEMGGLTPNELATE